MTNKENFPIEVSDAECKSWVAKNLSDKPPFQLSKPLAVGEHVIFTNDYGVEFEQRIIGFSDNELNERFGGEQVVYTYSEGAAYWMPKKVKQLRLAE